MNKFLIIILVLLIIFVGLLLFNKYFKAKSIFDEVKLPEPLYEP